MKDEILRVDNPYTGEIAVERKLLRADEVDAVMTRAHAAHLEFKKTTIKQRIELVHRFVAEFEKERARYAKEITESMGKPLIQADREINGLADRAKQMASMAEEALAHEKLPAKEGFERWISHEPVGVVAVLAAWNYPLLIAVNPTVAAILAGNAVVMKHSSRTPTCGEMFAEAFARAGAPKDLVQAVHADHAVTELIVQHPLTGFVSFTGSVGGGRKIYQAVAEKRFIDVTLELGGKDPAYVCSDAPFDYAVGEVVDGGLYNAGQSCCGVERVYVDASIYDRFVEAAIEAVRKYSKLGDPMDKDTLIGPMAQANAPAFLAGQVEAAKKLGARVVIGGEPTNLGGKGRFFAPGLVVDTDHRMAVAVEESFGPVLAVQKVSGDAEAIRLMNDSPYGLTASVWTGDLDRGKRITEQVDAGTVFVNRCDFLDPMLAWTGYKDSGKGISLSKLGFRSMTKAKSHHIKTKW